MEPCQHGHCTPAGTHAQLTAQLHELALLVLPTAQSLTLTSGGSCCPGAPPAASTSLHSTCVACMRAYTWDGEQHRHAVSAAVPSSGVVSCAVAVCRQKRLLVGWWTTLATCCTASSSAMATTGTWTGMQWQLRRAAWLPAPAWPLQKGPLLALASWL